MSQSHHQWRLINSCYLRNNAFWLPEIWAFIGQQQQWNITEQPVCVKCHPTLSSIVSHSLSINLRPWEKNHSFMFSFCLFKALTFQILSNPHLNFSDYWNPEPWNAWSPLKCRCLPTKSSRIYVRLLVVACFYVYLCLKSNYATFAQRGGLQVCSFGCIHTGWFK